MTDIEEFVYKISFIDFHILEQKEELIKKLKEALEFEQTKQKEGIEEIIKNFPLDFPLELQQEEIEYFNKEQNLRILFTEKLIKLVQELSIPQELEESSGENRNSQNHTQKTKIRQPNIENIENQILITNQKLFYIQNQINNLIKNLDYIQALDLVKENKNLTQRLIILEKSHQELHNKIDKLLDIVLKQNKLIIAINKIVHE